MSAKQILVVEDERPIREMIAFGLRRAGFEVREAADARSGRAEVANKLPDLLLVDWMLPDTSGLEFTRALKRDRETRELPVIMLTARAEEGDQEVLGAVRTAGRALGGAIAHLVATLDVRHIALVGTVTTLGDPWLDAVRDEATSRSLAATGHETVIENGGTGEDVTLLGACALLLTRELGLTVHR